ncbi:MAG: hypothetical protein KIS66_04815 [Fimbriimonadaceae bacterium]|nr:hypothetical protein [Fimbriimonadaceae bacterium]
MNLKTRLIDGFRYDLWANRAWLAVLPRLADPEDGRQVLRHILNAQIVWRARIVGTTPEIATEVDDGSLESSALAWIGLLEERDLGEVVSYRTTLGVAYDQPLHEIAYHVVNHGTYHRGHLRGLADAQGMSDFPETDFVGWVRTGASR